LRLRKRLGPLDALLKLSGLLVVALSLGSLSLEKTEYVVVFEKPRS
jgi:hypothetical protein